MHLQQKQRDMKKLWDFTGQNASKTRTAGTRGGNDRKRLSHCRTLDRRSSLLFGAFALRLPPLVLRSFILFHFKMAFRHFEREVCKFSENDDTRLQTLQRSETHIVNSAQPHCRLITQMSVEPTILHPCGPRKLQSN